MDQTPVRIAGERVTRSDAIEVKSPYDGRVAGLVPKCSAADVDSACQAAATALARDNFPTHARGAVLTRAAALVAERCEDFARTIAEEAGKPIKTARVEAKRCVDTLTFAAAEARTLTGELVPMDASEAGAGRLGFAFRFPIGVIAAISPFNFPLNLVAHKLAPAIAAGCPVVLKPASATPLSAIALVETLVEAGMPEDWVSVVTGGGAEVGDALVCHDIPRMISFTGSSEVGWGLPAKAPKKKVALELGSNSPVIVEPDADLSIVVEKLRVAGFSHAGQSCISTQRVLVHHDVHDSLADALVPAVESLVVGDPLKETTDVGPLITESERDRVAEWIAAAKNNGARVLCGGRVEDGVLLPTVVTDIDTKEPLSRCEVFGPVLVLHRYSTFDEALDMANDSELGLQAGVFTNDINKALKAARRLHFGGILINDVPTYRADQQPYGGVKDSGNTREGPRYSVREMTELRFVGIA